MFLWLNFTIFVNALKSFQFSKDEFTQGLSLGFIAGFLGLLTHALTANTFIIVRIMEPFWFLTAIVMALSELELRKEYGETISVYATKGES